MLVIFTAFNRVKLSPVVPLVNSLSVNAYNTDKTRKDEILQFLSVQKALSDKDTKKQIGTSFCVRIWESIVS